MVEFILLFVLSYQQEPITCTVITPDKVVECPARSTLNKSKMLRQRIDHWPEDLLDVWHLDVEYVDQPGGGRDISYNAPLKKVAVKAGQQVKAVYEDGRLVPLPNCAVRTYQQVREFTDMGQPAPNSACRAPDDCAETVRY